MDRNFYTLASVSVLVIACTYWIAARRRRTSKLPPSQWGLPLIGHLHLVGTAPHKSLYSLSKKLGPIMFIKLGLVPAVVISNAQLAKEIFTTHDTAFSDRPFLLVGEFIMYNFKGASFSPYGQDWKNIRKLYSAEIFTERRLNSYLWVRLEELSLVFSTLFQAHASKQAVNMREVFTTSTFNVMTQILMSKRYFGIGKDEQAEAREFKHLVQAAFKLALGFHPSEFFPPTVRRIVRWFDWSIPQFRKIRSKVDKFLDRIINEHLDSKSTRSCEDLMDIILKAFEDDDHRDDIVKASIMEMLLAGTDTSAVTSEWVLAELLHNPHIMKKAQEEIDQVVGKDRMVHEVDFSKLEYLQAVLKETFRVCSISPLLVPRLCSKDSEVGGYHIPKGATVMINAYAIGRDEKVWKNPTVFYPERFIGSPIKINGPDFELIPFGAGRKICPGMPLGLKTVQLVVANLIHGFDWGFPNDGTTQTLDDMFSSVLVLRNPLRAVAVPRLPLEAYSKFQ